MTLIPSRYPWQRRAILVETDLTCVNCHYNLRGLPLSGRCPECGQDVWDALLNQKYDAFRESMLRARRGCMALALWPILIIITLAAGHDDQTLTPAPLITGIASSLCLLLGGPVWAAMPLMQLQQTARQTTAILICSTLGIAIVCTGATLTGPLSTSFHFSPDLLKEILILISAFQYFLLLDVPARLLLMLKNEEQWRYLQALRLTAGLLGILATIALFYRLAFPDWALDNVLQWLASAIAIFTLPLLCSASIAFSSHVR